LREGIDVAGTPLPWDPTPEEIGAACARIQRGWSPEERRRRLYGMLPGRRCASQPIAELPRWAPPVIDAEPEVAAALEVM
jgi:hypothetical protein